MDYFKSSEYYRLDGQFAKFKTKAYPLPKGREAAQQVRSELQAALQQHPNIHGMGVMVLVQDYRRVLSLREAVGILPENPYHAALNSVIFETVKKVRKIPGHHMVAFVHDSGPDFDSLRSSYEKFKELNPKTGKFLGEFIRLDDKEHPPLQSADMIANYTMQLGLDGLASGDMKANVNEMKANIRSLGFWNEDYILSVLKSNLMTHGKTVPLDLQDERY